MCFRRRSSPPCVCLCAQLDYLTPAIGAIDEKIQSIAKADPTMLRLCTVPGVGFLTAHAIVAAVGDGRRFASARDFAAWAGMTPREDSSAGKRRMEGLSRQGERRLRKLLALGWPRPPRRPGSRLGGVDLGKDTRRRRRPNRRGQARTPCHLFFLQFEATRRDVGSPIRDTHRGRRSWNRARKAE
jgi:hypothetical protein